MMNFEEYRKGAIESLRSYNLPKDYVDEVINGDYIRASYLEDVRSAELLGYDDVSPSDFGFGCHMMWPDPPYTDEQLDKILNDKDNPFAKDMKFRSVRKKK